MKPSPYATALLLLLAACSKSDDQATKANTWKLGTTTYTASRYMRTTNDFQIFDGSDNGVTFAFESFPTKDGQYKVVGPSNSLGANDVHVVALKNATGASYFASGLDQTIATIKIIGANRLSVTLPNTWVVKGKDSLKLTANLGDL